MQSYNEEKKSTSKSLREAIREEIKSKPKEMEKRQKHNQERKEGRASETAKERILEDLTKQAGGTAEGTLIMVAGLMQSGATSKKQFAKNAEEWGGARITIGMLRNACSNHKTTVRQLARGMANDIIEVMKGMGEYAQGGNLSKRYQAEFPEATIEQLIWVSDFQTFNPECPEEVKKWLTNDYHSRFSNKA